MIKYQKSYNFHVMGFPPRQYHEGFWYHVYARSLEEVCLFANDDEKLWFIDRLDELFQRRRTRLGALCLMRSHYHALVRMGPTRLDKVLNGLHMSYAKHVNHQRGREGPVFRSRPGADIVVDDSYLLQLVPYIHQNPVKAGVVSKPEKYRWHTDRVYRQGLGEDWELDCWRFPPNFEGEERVRVYKQRMNEAVEAPEAAEGYVGSEKEWNQLERRDKQRGDRYSDRRGRASKQEILERVIEGRDFTGQDLKEPGRSQPEARLRQRAMKRMYEEGYGPVEIGEWFNRDKSTVMYAVRKEKD